MDNILRGLNEAQGIAVTSAASVLQVLAPPGSGKTKTLTARVAYLIAHAQLKPWNIIVCTFTVKAANEMKERIRAFIGPELAKDLKLGTFHSIALRYLKHYGHYIGLPKDFGVADTSDSKAILKRIIKKSGFGMEPSQVLGRISTRKVKGTADDQKHKPAKSVSQQEFDLIFTEYEATLAASNLLDYDDLLVRCCFLLQTYPQCVSNVQAVLIDEFQDTNNVQYDLMGLFAQHNNTITIVGDPDQSIYGFRMAEIKNLTRMKAQWPDTLTINLQENYRSSGAILHAAQKLIEQDESRPPKRLQATHSFGYRPVLRKLSTASAEAEWLVSEIKRSQGLTGQMLQHNDYAILLRSAALSRVIETALSNAGIPYRMVGGMKFYDRLEIKLIIDYLRVIHQPENSEAVERIINVPPRRIGEETVKKLREEAQKKRKSLWNLVLGAAQGHSATTTKISGPAQKGLESFTNVVLTGQKKVNAWENGSASMEDLVKLVVDKISLHSYLKTKFAEDESFEARWANVDELFAQTREMADPTKLLAMVEADALPTVDGLEQRSTTLQDALSLFLTNIALTASAEKKAEESGEKIQQVTVSTIHAAKGLEWPVVFIPACYTGSIPHSRAEDTDEERRLLYVGMTRAQALLYLSCPVRSTQREETSMSEFLVHEGMSTFFEEHGPSIPIAAVEGLATTLKREPPSVQQMQSSRSKLGQDEDNHWPLNGEEPLEEASRYDYNTSSSAWPALSNQTFSSHAPWNTPVLQQQHVPSQSGTLPKPGFVSVAARYDELMEQAQLRKTEKRAEIQEKKVNAPKGRKRQLDGQETIFGFLNKRANCLPTQPEPQPGLTRNDNAGEPLRDVSNTAPQHNAQGSKYSTGLINMAAHRICDKPMQRRPTSQRLFHGANDTDVSTVSGSLKSPDNAEATATLGPTMKPTASEDASGTLMRPAKTFHTTTMDRLTPQRRTLGVKRSLRGWNARKNG